MIFKEVLQKHFDKEDIKYRVASSGCSNGRPWVKVLAYIDARLIENRLDEVFGWDCWSTKYEKIDFVDNKGVNKTGFICTIEIVYNDRLISKSNGADLTDYESFKGGISDSFKRAAAHGLGIGRELYELKEIFAEVSENRTDVCTERVKILINSKSKEYKYYYWGLKNNNNNNTNTNTNKTAQKKQTDSYKSVDSKGNPVTIEDTDKIVTDKQLKRMFAIQKQTFLSEEDVKIDIKERYNYDSRKDFRRSKYDEYCNYLESLIDDKDFEELSNKLVEKDKKIEDLKPFLKKWKVKEINRLTKEQCNVLIERLNKT